MNERDQQLAGRVARSFPEATDVPDFDRVFGATEKRYRSQRRRYRWAGAAAVAAMLVFASVSLNTPRGPEIEIVGLLDSTYWTAPSDVLLPEHQFDLYQDIPVLPQSTEQGGGTLL